MNRETKKKLKELKAKTLRWLGITKPIELSMYEVMWVKMCKGHYRGEYPWTGSWVESLKPLFNEIYGWSADEYYRDYLGCMFNKLLEIHLKIADDQSGSNVQLRDVFYASFEKSYRREEELPIERAIATLCANIQNTTYLKDGVERYNIEIKE